MGTFDKNRNIGVTTPIGDDVLFLLSMEGTEQVSTLFEYELELTSHSFDIDFNKIIGDKITVRFTLDDGADRYFNGVVSRFTQAGFSDNLAHFKATLVPWMWFLTHSANCRIFQKMKVPDIIQQILGDEGFNDVELSLSGEYREWEYCVQYCETDFNFISRLMEQEGIYYFFKQEKGKHTLVLADSISAHESLKGYETIPFFPPADTPLRERDHISTWSLTREVMTGTYVHTDYDFKKPKKPLLAKSTVKRKNAGSSYEVFSYPGEYVESAEGENYAKIRLQELQSSFERFYGGGNVQGISAGALFTLDKLPRTDQNKEYLVLSAQYQLKSVTSGSDDKISSDIEFYCQFSAIDSVEPFRPPRITSKPMVQGVQTAIVVGKSGEEIWTDEFGRVKVQFHWDRLGKSDENSSCWMRVSQAWAGAGWGAMHLPHVGHEVIVNFLEGDPDRPIITGRVYHGDNKPGEPLPDNKTKSVILSCGDNDIIVEDKEGDKHILIKQACGNEIHMHEKTPDIEIKQECGNEILMKASGPDIEIKQKCGNEILMHEADGIQIRDKYGNEVVLDAPTGFMRLHSPTHESSIEIGKSIKSSTLSTLEWAVAKDEIKKVKGKTLWECGGNLTKLTVGATSEEFVGAKHTSNIGLFSEVSLAIKKEVNLKEKIIKTKNFNINATNLFKVEVGKGDVSEINMDSSHVYIECGKSSIFIHKDGDIFVNSNGDINFEAKGDIKMKAKKFTVDANLSHFKKGTLKHKDTIIS